MTRVGLPPLDQSGGSAGPGGPRASSRLVLPDALKWLAAHLIVWHHLALYGPLARAWAEHTPALHGWVATHGRLAVQVFLMLGGYLALRSLQARWPAQWPAWGVLPRWWWQRFVRLGAPYAVALAMALAANAWGYGWLDEHAVGDGHSVGDVLAHLALLHSALGVESISAGVWYVAIDWQLFVALSVLMAATCTVARGGAHALPAVLLVGVAVSLLSFNRDPRWDVWAMYFFAAYGAGALLAAVEGQVPRVRWVYWAALLTLLALRLAQAPSAQVATQLGAVLLLMGAQGLARRDRPAQAVRTPGPGPADIARHLASVGARDAYALFLVHFAVLTTVNTAWARWAPPEWQQPANVSAAAVFAALVLAWLISLVLARWLHRAVEAPVARWIESRQTHRPRGL